MTASPDFYVLELGKVLGFEEIICTGTEYVAGQMSVRLAGANVRDMEEVRRLEDLRGRFQNHFITGRFQVPSATGE